MYMYTHTHTYMYMFIPDIDRLIGGVGRLLPWPRSSDLAEAMPGKNERREKSVAEIGHESTEPDESENQAARNGAGQDTEWKNLYL